MATETGQAEDKKDFAEPKLTRLRELFRYDPETGAWTHLKARQRVRAGTPAGSPYGGLGYWRLSVDGRGYLAHRLAWLYMTGEWPKLQIDHINGDRADNRWSNLRLASNGQNKANSRRARNNTSGYKGVQYNARLGRWYSSVTARGHRTYLGCFSTPQEAHRAYLAMAERLHGEYARAG